jgi:hypothetical protein
MSHVLLCDLFSRDEIRPRFSGAPDLWKRVEQNQDERYHHFDPSRVGEEPFGLNDVYLDFKKAFTLPMDRLYEGILSGSTERVAVVREFYIHDLIHRFYGFLSRVAVPV